MRLRSDTRRMRLARVLVVLLVATAGIHGCSSPPPAPPDPPEIPVAPPDPAAFQPVRARAIAADLSSDGWPLAGTSGAASVRKRIKEELTGIGAGIREVRAEVAGIAGEGNRRGGDVVSFTALRTVIGELPGESPDVFMLLARYAREPAEGSFEDGDALSGAGVALELARALSVRPRPYTIWLVFLEGAGGLAGLTSGADAQRARLALYFDRVGASGLTLARDVRSHRLFRETLWRAGRDLGHGGVFDASRPLTSPTGPHLELMSQRVRGAVALVGDGSGGECCALESLDAVGATALLGLTRIAAQLAQIDRYADSPLQGAPADPPGSSEAGPDRTTTSPGETGGGGPDGESSR